MGSRLERLPSEVALLIIGGRFLDTASLRNLQQCCHRICAAMKTHSNELWRMRLERSFTASLRGTGIQGACRLSKRTRNFIHNGFETCNNRGVRS